MVDRFVSLQNLPNAGSLNKKTPIRRRSAAGFWCFEPRHRVQNLVAAPGRLLSAERGDQRAPVEAGLGSRPSAGRLKHTGLSFKAVGQNDVLKMGCPATWNQAPKPAVSWLFNFEPFPFQQNPVAPVTTIAGNQGCFPLILHHGANCLWIPNSFSLNIFVDWTVNMTEMTKY